MPDRLAPYDPLAFNIEFCTATDACKLLGIGKPLLLQLTREGLVTVMDVPNKHHRACRHYRIADLTAELTPRIRELRHEARLRAGQTHHTNAQARRRTTSTTGSNGNGTTGTAPVLELLELPLDGTKPLPAFVPTSQAEIRFERQLANLAVVIDTRAQEAENRLARIENMLGHLWRTWCDVPVTPTIRADEVPRRGNTW